jgi:drug/metabolite transporter (DMT)-like permease
MEPSRRSIWVALFAALLFGATTPLAKLLLHQVHPALLAGLFYLGSGIALETLVAFKTSLPQSAKGSDDAKLSIKDLPWLVGAVFFGGMLGPLLLMLGLSKVTASTASLLLNLEAVFTIVIAGLFFHENVGRRIAFGLVAIVAGGALLSTGTAGFTEFQLSMPSLLIAGACLCWAIDNNLTTKIAYADPVHTAGLKGLVAGGSNLLLALAAGVSLPSAAPVIGAALVGAVGYGLSLSLYILALRDLGTARTSAYFAVAPFIGAILSVIFLHDHVSAQILASGFLMALGVWLHITEEHEHWHVHEPSEHEHMHTHDEHHQHEHDPLVDITEPHSHKHRHGAISHSHSHYPDLHHRHHH